MALDADLIVDRRRMKRRLVVWRLTAVLAIVVAAVAFAGRFDVFGQGEMVARLTVSGLILDDPWRDEALRELGDDDRVRALIVKIDSPGGTVAGGEALYLSLRGVAAHKPVVAVLGELATSAGYMIALGADRILGRAGTVTGSIGVLIQSADITGLLETLGVKPEAVKSHPLKAQPNPLEPFSDEARQTIRAVVMDLYAMFVDMVAERRGMDRQRVLVLADGRIYSGRQAVDNGLLDAIGGEPEARQWLAESHGVSLELPVRDIESDADDALWRRLADGLTRSLVGKVLNSERLSLDGALSVWQPDGT